MATRFTILQEARITLGLALPMAAGQLGQMLLGFSDSLMVGRLGVVPLAASAFANGIISVLLVAGIGLLASVSVLASQAHGAGRERDAGEVLRQGLAIAAVVGTFVGFVLTTGLGMLAWLRPPAEVLTAARPFLVIVGWSVAPALVWQGLKQFCEALLRPLVPMLTMFAAVVLNVFLSWVLIYGRLGMPALGLVGAAWATLISRLLFMVVLFVVVLRSPAFHKALPDRWLARLRWQALRTQLSIGLPVAAQLLMEVGAFATAAIMMGWLGADALAAHQVALSYCALTFMLPLGLSLAVSVRMGQAVGAGEWERLRMIGHSGLLMAVIIMSVFATGFFAGGGFLAALFVREHPVVLVAARLLGVAAVFQLFDGVQVVTMGALRGLSDVRLPTAICFVAYWLIALPVSYAAGFIGHAGPRGVWWGLATGLAVAALALLWRFEVKTRADRRAAMAAVIAGEFTR